VRKSLPIASVSVVVVLVAGIIGARRAIKRQVARAESLRIECGEAYVARAQMGVPQYRIHRDEIASIEEWDSGLLVRSPDRFRSLWVPVDLGSAAYQEIRGVLATWPTIRSASRAKVIRLYLDAGAILVAFLIISFSPLLWISLAAGVGLLAYYVWSYWRLHKTTGVDRRLRHSVLLQMLFVAFILSMKVCGYVLILIGRKAQPY